MNNIDMQGKPSGICVIGSYSVHASMRDWHHAEDLFNPGRFFKEMHLVTLDDEQDYQDLMLGSIIIHPIKVPKIFVKAKVLNNVLKIIKATLNVYKILRNNHVDLLIQTDGTPLKYGLPIILPALLFGKPSLLTLHNDYERMMAFTYSRMVRKPLYFFWNFLLSKATHIRCVSEYISNFVYQFHVNPSKVTVIPNKEVLETFAFSPSSAEIKRVGESMGLYKSDGKIIILSNGRLIKVKNYEKTLEAFSIAHQKNENLEYWIVGDGSMLADLKKIVQDLDIESSVKFLGYFPHSQVRYIYKLSDIFLLASFYEGQPRVIVEALLAKLPIICTNYGQMCEVVKDQVDGIWVDPQNVNEIADAIYALSVDEELRRRMSSHNEIDLNQFSYEAVNAKEKRLFQSVINKFEEVKE